ncbi:MAG: hypothetical protein ACOYLO_12435 [Ferruginibacter sp.]
MKNTLLLCFVFSFFALTSNAQAPPKAALEFVKLLNKIAYHTSVPSPWEFEGKFSMDSAYAISKTGLLSTTFRYTTDTSVLRIRMTVAVADIRDIFYDYYIGLVCYSDAVTIYEATSSSSTLIESGKNYLFHVGISDYEGEKQQEQLQKILVQLKKYYK